ARFVFNRGPYSFLFVLPLGRPTLPRRGSPASRRAAGQMRLSKAFPLISGKRSRHASMAASFVVVLLDCNHVLSHSMMGFSSSLAASAADDAGVSERLLSCRVISPCGRGRTKT